MKRFIPVFFAAVVVNLFLFLMMHQMISGETITKKNVDFKGVEFIRFKAQSEPPPEKRKKLPKRPILKKMPPPKIIKKSKPKLKKLKQVRRPPVEPIKPSMDLSRQAYLGDFVADPPPPPPPTVKAVPVQESIEEVVEVQPEPETIEAPVEAPVAVEIEVDVAPLFRIPPTYPRRAIRAKIEGVVTVQFTITIDGSVQDPVVVRSNPEEIFDQAALRAIRKWKFRPKRTSGRAVVRHAIQNIRFNFTDTD
ncbi:MAG: energy transducer TonB [Nitrospiria bacterium]